MLPALVFFLYVYRRFRSNATGEKVTYTNWASNQPDNNGASGEDCVIENNDGTWSDVDCRWDHPYITSAHFWTFFWPTHPLCQHIYSTENQQKSPFSEPAQSICWHDIWMVPGCSGLEAVAVCNADSLALDCDTGDPNWYEIEGKFNSSWDVSRLGLHSHIVVT